MRNAIVLVLLLAIALPLSASWWPEWTPTRVHVLVGDTAIVQVRARWSGLVDYGGGVHWRFASDNDQVAIASAQVDDTQIHDVPIVAVGPGAASIRQQTGAGGFREPAWVVIYVTCGVEPPVRAVDAVSRARVGQPFPLEVVAASPERTTFTWYLGREGDRSHPIDGSGPATIFVPKTSGTYYFWVSASTACSTSSTELRVEVDGESFRKRSVRK